MDKLKTFSTLLIDIYIYIYKIKISKLKTEIKIYT